MKKIVFTLFVIALGFGLQAQHTLSYSQALLITSSGGTVPSIAGGSGYNAVWKVVSFMPSANSIQNSGNNSNNPGEGTYSISINSNTVYVSKVQALAVGAGYAPGESFTNVSGDGILPMWLPGGTTLATGTNIKYVNVIEFIVN